LIAVDTSAMARALDGINDETTRAVRKAVESEEAYFPPAVLTELLSNPELKDEARFYCERIPLLDIHTGFWERAGILRAELMKHVFKASLADVLIAQSCIDHDIPLITYDRDFRHFVRAGLKLA